MTISTKFATLALGAASMIALMIAPASAQTLGGSNCSRYKDLDKTKQCLHALEVQRMSSFIKANPPTRTTDYFPPNTGNVVQILDGRGYRIVLGAQGGIAASGRASFLNTRPGGGGSGGKRSTN
jgi:hypothetical protein